MFSFLLSKNKKMIKNWEKEHIKIVELAHIIINAYTKENYTQAKKALKELNTLAVDHIMKEDIIFYKMLKDKDLLDENTTKLMQEFVHSFKNTKMTLMNFLTKYSKEDIELDEKFFNTFKSIVAIVASRIEFEEKNLYKELSKS